MDIVKLWVKNVENVRLIFIVYIFAVRSIFIFVFEDDVLIVKVEWREF